ncbi:hypothetical protein A2U01_0078488, partial [Trifolium medium]|nr:hypothetical protein [Trifolium medium]
KKTHSFTDVAARREDNGLRTAQRHGEKNNGLKTAQRHGEMNDGLRTTQREERRVDDDGRKSITTLERVIRRRRWRFLSRSTHPLPSSTN